MLPQDTVETAVRKIVSRHLSRLRQHDPGARIGKDPEALHDMRVAVRRLRAAVRMFAPGFPPRMQRRLRDELKWLGQLSGGVRDLDVQLARLQEHSSALPAGRRVGLVSLRRDMEAERRRRRTEFLQGLDSRRYSNLLVRLEDFALGRSAARLGKAAQEPIAHAGARGIKRALRRLRKCGDKVEGTPTPEDLHALRIRAKRLRYPLEFLQELTGKPGRRLVKQLVRLQDLLGAYHDAMVTADFVRHYAEGPGAQSDAASLLTLGALVNDALRIAEENRQRFQRTWRRFTRKGTQRQFRTMLRELRGEEVTRNHESGGTGPHASRDVPTPAPAEQTDSPEPAFSPVRDGGSTESEADK